jgi:hypothetical protein
VAQAALGRAWARVARLTACEFGAHFSEPVSARWKQTDLPLQSGGRRKILAHIIFLSSTNELRGTQVHRAWLGGSLDAGCFRSFVASSTCGARDVVPSASRSRR